MYSNSYSSNESEYPSGGIDLGGMAQGGGYVGEIADYIVDQMSSGFWHCGYSYIYERKQPTCRKCNDKNVYWHQYDSGKWFLFDKDTKKAHVCTSTSEE